MNKKQIGLQLIFWGSIWGLLEVLIDTFCISFTMVPRSILLGGFAIFILAIANRTSEDSMVSLKMGFIAAFYKFLNVMFFPCQFFAVMIFGILYQFQARLAYKMKIENIIIRGLFVSCTMIIFNVLFAIGATYIFKYSYWVDGGSQKFIQFVFIEGSITTIFGFVSFIAGDHLGKFLKPVISNFAQNKANIYAFGTTTFSLIVLILMFVL